MQIVREEVVARLAGTRKWSAETARLGERAGYCCEYCDLDLLASAQSYKLWQVDHIVPVSCGGDLSSPSNLAVTCKTCNWDWKHSWDPRTEVGQDATRDELIAAVRRHIAGKKAMTEAQLSEVREIVGYRKGSM